MSYIDKVRQAVYANSESYYHRRARAIGFELDKPRIKMILNDSVEVYGKFKCVCGVVEVYRFIIDNSLIDNLPYTISTFDMAERLHRLGSFSKDHLMEDGYSEEQVELILSKGTEFDNLEPTRKSHESLYWLR